MKKEKGNSSPTKIKDFGRGLLANNVKKIENTEMGEFINISLEDFVKITKKQPTFFGFTVPTSQIRMLQKLKRKHGERKIMTNEEAFPHVGDTIAIEFHNGKKVETHIGFYDGSFDVSEIRSYWQINNVFYDADRIIKYKIIRRNDNDSYRMDMTKFIAELEQFDEDVKAKHMTI